MKNQILKVAKKKDPTNTVGWGRNHTIEGRGKLSALFQAVSGVSSKLMIVQNIDTISITHTLGWKLFDRQMGRGIWLNKLGFVLFQLNEPVWLCVQIHKMHLESSRRKTNPVRQ